MAEQPNPPTILVVDNDEGLLSLIGPALRCEGWTVTTAASGAAALEWLGRNTADLMLVDLKRPEIETKELLTRLRDASRSIPFIVITGQGNEQAAVEMMKLGARDCLVKDMSFLGFVPEVVRHTLGELAKEKRLAEAEEALRRSQANLMHAQRVAHIGSYEFELPGAPNLQWSAETFRILGFDPAQPAPSRLSLEEYIARLVHPDDRVRVREEIERTMNEAARYDVEYRIVRLDGSIRYVHSVAEPVLDPDKKVLKVVGSIQDVTERKELEKQILEISEREQSRIGQDLHDGLCQHLAGIEFRLWLLKQKLAAKSNQQAAEVAELAEMVRDGIEQARTLAHGLSPILLHGDGLITALQDLAAGTEGSFQISCSFVCPAPVPLHDDTTSTHLYRIAQEAVQNAIRHGHPKFIVISLLMADDRIVLTVKDDGVGLPNQPARPKGMGLRIMQYRAGMVGGALAVQAEPEGGTSVTCSLRASSRAPVIERTEGKSCVSLNH